jgi:type IV pilus biogenesis protein CpaD/CtpE
MNMTIKINHPFPYLCLLLGFMSACGSIEYAPTNFAENRQVQLVAGQSENIIDLKQLDETTIDKIANHYARYGTSAAKLSLVVPKGLSDADQELAWDRLKDIKHDLTYRQVNVEKIDLRPVNSQDTAPENVGQLLVSYKTLNVEPAKNCPLMQGMNGKGTDLPLDPDSPIQDQQKFGCTIEYYFAQQIARPKDLRRDAPIDPSNNIQEHTILFRVHDGIPSDSLTGLSTNAGQ